MTKLNLILTALLTLMLGAGFGCKAGLERDKALRKASEELQGQWNLVSIECGSQPSNLLPAQALLAGNPFSQHWSIGEKLSTMSWTYPTQTPEENACVQEVPYEVVVDLAREKEDPDLLRLTEGTKSCSEECGTAQSFGCNTSPIEPKFTRAFSVSGHNLFVIDEELMPTEGVCADGNQPGPTTWVFERVLTPSF